MPKESDSAATEPMRIDRWLFFVRLFKSRILAGDAVTGGRVHLNAERVKPSKVVRVGDQVAFTRGTVPFDCEVLALPSRRGPAPEAAACYRESDASIARRAQFADRMRMSVAFAPRPDTRPGKHERRELRRIRGRD